MAYPALTCPFSCHEFFLRFVSWPQCEVRRAKVINWIRVLTSLLTIPCKLQPENPFNQLIFYTYFNLGQKILLTYLLRVFNFCRAGDLVDLLSFRFRWESIPRGYIDGGCSHQPRVHGQPSPDLLHDLPDRQCRQRQQRLQQRRTEHIRFRSGGHGGSIGFRRK